LPKDATPRGGIPKLPVLSSASEALLKQAVIAGLIDHVARKVPESKRDKNRPARDTPYVSCDENLQSRELHIHPHSVLLSLVSRIFSWFKYRI
jgi:hypothetical protein